MKLCLIRARYVKLFSDMRLRRMSEKTRRHHWVPPRPLFNRLRQADCAACLKKQSAPLGAASAAVQSSETGRPRRMSEKTRRHHWVPPRPLFNCLRQADRAACLKNKAAPLGVASAAVHMLSQADRAACLKNKAAPLGAASFKKAIKRSSAADYSSQPSINLIPPQV